MGSRFANSIRRYDIIREGITNNNRNQNQSCCQANQVVMNPVDISTNNLRG